jgi:hypothetical protein
VKENLTDFRKWKSISNGYLALFFLLLFTQPRSFMC